MEDQNDEEEETDTRKRRRKYELERERKKMWREGRGGEEVGKADKCRKEHRQNTVDKNCLSF